MISESLAQVYKANLDEVKEVAVKFLNPGVDNDMLSMRTFAAEVDIMRQSRDSNIVGFLGAWLQRVCAFHATHNAAKCCFVRLVEKEHQLSEPGLVPLGMPQFDNRGVCMCACVCACACACVCALTCVRA